MGHEIRIQHGRNFNWIEKSYNALILQLEGNKNDNTITFYPHRKRLVLPSNIENSPYDYDCNELLEAEIIVLGYLKSLNRELKEEFKNKELNYY